MRLDVAFSAGFCTPSTLKPWIFGHIQDNYEETQKNSFSSSFCTSEAGNGTSYRNTMVIM
jgi:hypothetical protein